MKNSKLKPGDVCVVVGNSYSEFTHYYGKFSVVEIVEVDEKDKDILECIGADEEDSEEVVIFQQWVWEKDLVKIGEI